MLDPNLFDYKPEVFWITVFASLWLPFFTRLIPKCQIAIHPDSIMELFGAVDTFAITTDSLAICFTQESVRIISQPIFDNGKNVESTARSLFESNWAELLRDMKSK